MAPIGASGATLELDLLVDGITSSSSDVTKAIRDEFIGLISSSTSIAIRGWPIAPKEVEDICGVELVPGKDGFLTCLADDTLEFIDPRVEVKAAGILEGREGEARRPACPIGARPGGVALRKVPNGGNSGSSNDVLFVFVKGVEKAEDPMAPNAGCPRPTWGGSGLEGGGIGDVLMLP